jgi:hypothetical protein
LKRQNQMCGSKRKNWFDPETTFFKSKHSATNKYGERNI